MRGRYCKTMLAGLMALLAVLPLSPLPARPAQATSPADQTILPTTAVESQAGIRINEVMPKPEQGDFE